MTQIKRKSRSYIVWVLIASLLGGVFTEGCKSSSKKCGCGHDLNAIYKPRKRGGW